MTFCWLLVSYLHFNSYYCLYLWELCWYLLMIFLLLEPLMGISVMTFHWQNLSHLLCHWKICCFARIWYFSQKQEVTHIEKRIPAGDFSKIESLLFEISGVYLFLTQFEPLGLLVFLHFLRQCRTRKYTKIIFRSIENLVNTWLSIINNYIFYKKTPWVLWN